MITYIATFFYFYNNVQTPTFLPFEAESRESAFAAAQEVANAQGMRLAGVAQARGADVPPQNYGMMLKSWDSCFCEQ